MRKNRQGFTLVEIMIVVAIIALLAVIAIPNLMRARVSANDALAQSTLRTLATAVQNYQADNDGANPADWAALYDGTNPNLSYTQIEYKAADTHSGFKYTFTPAASGSSFTISAAPATCKSTGSKTCTINQTGQVSCAACT